MINGRHTAFNMYKFVHDWHGVSDRLTLAFRMMNCFRRECCTPRIYYLFFDRRTREQVLPQLPTKSVTRWLPPCWLSSTGEQPSSTRLSFTHLSFFFIRLDGTLSLGQLICIFSGAPQIFNKPTLTCLPTELHLEFVKHLRIASSWNDLCALSLTCSLFRDIAQKALYTSIEISHQMQQLEKIHPAYERDEGTEPGLDGDSARAAISSPVLDHPLRSFASNMVKHPNLLHHVRTLIVDCGCYLGCEHHVLVIQLANLFLDHLVAMPGLRKLELRITLIIEPSILSGIIALARHNLQEITLDLVYPPVAALQSLTDHNLEPFSCTSLGIYMGDQDLSDFYAWFLERCQRLTGLALRGDIFVLLSSIKDLTFGNLNRLTIESWNPDLAEPLSAFLQCNPSITNLHLCVPDAVGSDITVSGDDLPDLRSIHAPVLVLCKLIPGRPVVHIRTDLVNTEPKIGLVSQLIDAAGHSSAQVIEEFAVGVSPREDLEGTLDKILKRMKSVTHLRLHDLPDEPEV